MNKYIVLTWNNSCPINDILFGLTDPYIMYIDSDILKPRYEIEEDGAQDGNGEFVPTYQKLTKIYNLTISPIIESQVDALHIMSMCDTVTIRDKNFDEYIIKQGSIQLTVEWLTDEYASVEMAFQVDDVVVRNNCCN